MTDARIEAAAKAIAEYVYERNGKPMKWENMGDNRQEVARCYARVALEAADAAAWIKISDKTPDDNQDVLVATYERIVTADTFNMDDEGGYFDITDDEEVTHWQPLPAPPYTPLEGGGNG